MIPVPSGMLMIQGIIFKSQYHLFILFRLLVYRGMADIFNHSQTSGCSKRFSNKAAGETKPEA
jgi:hypothetical protein